MRAVKTYAELRARMELWDPRARSWHPKFIAGLARITRAENYLEVGVYRGETIRKVSKFCSNNVGVDIDQEAIESIAGIRNVTGFLGSLQDFCLQPQEIKFDLIFIDANHDVQSVVRDFESAKTLISEKGLVLLHDTWPKNSNFISPQFCGTAYQAVQIIRSEHPAWNLITITTHPGITVCQSTKAFPLL